MLTDQKGAAVQPAKHTIENPYARFSSEWWNRFLEDTNNLNNPVCYSNVFREDVPLLREELLDVFRNIPKEDHTFRVWVEGKQRDDMIKHMVANPPQTGDSFENWTERLFEGKKFGIIFNYGECFNKALSLHMLDFLQPLLETRGYPVRGIDFTIFIGNYGYTPLGIHQDWTGENVMHFHLGPGKKTMYMWTDTVYREKGGKFNEKNIEPWLESAEYEMTFGEGEYFFMPWHYFHVGKSDDFSVGITVWFNRPTRAEILNRLTSIVLDEYFDSDRDNRNTIIEMEKDLIAHDLFGAVRDGIKLEDGKDSILTLLDHASKEFKYSIKSNLGFGKPFIIDRERENKELNGSDIIKIDDPFKILHYTAENNQIKIFVKGFRIVLNYHPDIVTLIERLNEGREDTIDNITTGLFEGWPEGASKRVVELIWQKHGVVVTTPVQ
jgi:hypothetical protein